MKDANQNVISKSNVNNSITYTGRRYDQESELYYYRNRMYSPTLGRFMQRDPKGYVDGMNLYAYVKNNPLKYLDAMGTTALNNSYYNYFKNEVSNVWNSSSNMISNSYHEVKTGVSSLLDGNFSLTVGVGGQASAVYGMSSAGGGGEFASIDYNNGKVNFTTGQYLNGEQGGGFTVTGASASAGGEVFMSNDNYKSALNGGYLNTGGSVSPGLGGFGYDVSTTAPDKNQNTTQTFSINFSASTPKIEGHSRLGYGKTYNEITTTFDIKSLLRLKDN